MILTDHIQTKEYIIKKNQIKTYFTNFDIRNCLTTNICMHSFMLSCCPSVVAMFIRLSMVSCLSVCCEHVYTLVYGIVLGRLLWTCRALTTSPWPISSKKKGNNPIGCLGICIPFVITLILTIFIFVLPELWAFIQWSLVSSKHIASQPNFALTGILHTWLCV
jgi:hypothetical protein